MKNNSEKFNVLCILAKAETQRYRTEYDKLKAKKVYARFPESDGVGLAVFNRLVRASGFSIIEV